MVGFIGGSNLIGRRMRKWRVNGTIHPVNAMETLKIKESKTVKIIGFLLFLH